MSDTFSYERQPKKPLFCCLHRLGSHTGDIKKADDICRQIAPFRHAMRRKVYVALDLDTVWAEKDGKWYVYFTHGAGMLRVGSKHFEEDLQKHIRRGDVSTPEAVFADAPSDMYFFIELKGGVGNRRQAMAHIVNLLNKYGVLKRCIFGSWQQELLMYMKHAYHGAPTYMMRIKRITSGLRTVGLASWKFESQEESAEELSKITKKGFGYWSGGVKTWQQFMIAYLDQVDGCFIELYHHEGHFKEWLQEMLHYERHH